MNDVGKPPRSVASDIRRMKRRRLGIRLAIGVGLPTLVAAIYYGFIASPQYESVAAVTVQSADGTSMPGFELIFATVPGGGAARDALIVQKYVASRDMLHQLSEENGFEEHYSSDEVDYFSRLSPDASFEQRFEYFGKKVNVEHDTQSGVLTLRVRAFSPEKAQELARAILEAGERMVNQMMESARRDRISLAQREVDSAEARLSKARASIVTLQSERSEINPAQSASALLEVRSNLEVELASARAELSALNSVLQPEAPRLLEQRRRVAALQHEVSAQNRRMTGEGDEDLAAAIARFEPVAMEKEFSDKAYQSALTSLELARLDADRQHRYMVTISAASKPDASTHPRIFMSILTVFAMSFAILVIGTLLLASVREHANI